MEIDKQKFIEKKENVKNKNEKFWTALDKNFKPFAFLLVIFVFAVSYFFFISPLIGEIQDNKSSVESKNLEIDEAKALLKKNKDYLQKFEEIKKYDLTMLDKIIPPKEGIHDVIVQLETLAAKSGINILGMEFGKESVRQDKKTSGTNKKKDTFTGGIAGMLPESFSTKVDAGVLKDRLRRLTVSLKVSGGGYSSIRNFINLLEKNLRVTDVSAFSFSPQSEEYMFTMKMYYIEE